MAALEGMDGLPIERYERVIRDCGNSLRKGLGVLQSGVMIGGAA